MILYVNVGFGENTNFLRQKLMEEKWKKKKKEREGQTTEGIWNKKYNSAWNSASEKGK